MTAEESLREGRLDEALARVQDQVRKDPASSKHRVFLFQLLSVLGDWPRALTQLNVLGDMDASTLPMVQTYREALRCEVLRSEIFAGRRAPVLFGEPEPWMALLIEALKHTAEGRPQQANPLRERAFEEAPVTAGTIDGQAFEWIADADSRLGPVLEAIVNGRYYWIPFRRIREIVIEAPTDLRDVVWTAVHFVWANGGESVGLVPTRYTGSEASPEAAIRLARKTEWTESGEGSFSGLGQRLLATDAGEFPLMDARKIVLEVEAPDAAPPGGVAAR